MSLNIDGLRATFRPIGTWPGSRTRERKTAKFRAGWRDTVARLNREVELPQPRQLVIQMDLTEREIRQDGYPRADARPAGPGVIVSIERRDGSWLHFPCDSYFDWQDNVRAIALTLEALRAIDRYGVTKTGEQYSGWKALPAQTGSTLSAEVPAEVLSRIGGGTVPRLLADPDAARDAYRRARRPPGRRRERRGVPAAPGGEARSRRPPHPLSYVTHAPSAISAGGESPALHPAVLSLLTDARLTEAARVLGALIAAHGPGRHHIPAETFQRALHRPVAGPGRPRAQRPAAVRLHQAEPRRAGDPRTPMSSGLTPRGMRS